MQKKKDLWSNWDKRLPAVGPALIAGMKDSVHPGAITGLLVFLVFLYFALRERKRMVVLGVYFLAGFYVCSLVVALGMLDTYLATRPFDIFLDVIYFSIAVAAVAIGAVLMRDWWVSKKGGGPAKSRISFASLEAPDPVSEASLGPRREGLGSGGVIAGRPKRCPKTLALLLGICLPFIESAWAPDVYLAMIFYEMTVPGQMSNAWVSLLAYGWAFALPLILLWVAAMGVVFIPGLSKSLQQAVAKLQVIFAAIFMGYGLTFLFRYYF